MIGSLGADLLGQGVDQLLGAGAPAGQVVAHVEYPRRALLHREQGVEGRDAVDVGGGNGQPLRDVVERARTDPTGLLVQRVQGGEELVALGAGGVAAVGGVAVLDPIRTGPGRDRGTEERVDRGALVGGWFGVEEAEIHAISETYSPASRLATPAASLAPPFSFSTRMAVALNSAVPDLRIGGVDRQHVDVDLVREVEGHERQSRAQAGVEPYGRLDRAAPRADLHHLAGLDAQLVRVLG